MEKARTDFLTQYVRNAHQRAYSHTLEKLMVTELWWRLIGEN